MNNGNKLTINVDTISKLLTLTSEDMAYVLRSAMLEFLHGEDNETCDESLNVIYRQIIADTTPYTAARRVA